MRTSLLLATAAAAAGLTCGLARASVNEPDGSTVPRDSKNGETQLYTLFQNRNDPIDFIADAHTTPATFSPLCDFRATFVLHQAGANRGVGWYNVDPAATAAPALADIHVIVPAGTAVGTQISSATIKGDPAYKGGLIGFALVDGQIHYSEQKWDPACALCSPAGPWITAVVYASKVTPNAYYLAFEDGNVNAFQFGNDGDFNDDVFFFEGLTCQGGGTPCTADLPGACSAGVNECSLTGLTCKPLTQPMAEKCNGIDDDCDGIVDNGDLCKTGFVCDHGTCVARCGSGEFACQGDLVCNQDGFCVDPDCASVTCPAGTVCAHGACKAPCDAIVCPAPAVCRAGICVDPCAGVVCDQGSVCSGGICVSGCDCTPCAQGLACDSATERCVEPACVGVSCASGTTCVGGACVDPCVGAMCPPRQACVQGACVENHAPDAGSSAGGSGASSGIVFPSGDGAGGDGSGAAGTVAAPDATTGVESGGRAPQGAALSCGCRTARASDADGAASWFGLLLLGTLGRRASRRGAISARARRSSSGVARTRWTSP
jgi:hypothetical protein